MNIGPQRYILAFLVTFLLAYIHVGDACPQDESVSDAGAANQANRDRVFVRLNPKKMVTDDRKAFRLEFILYRIQLGPGPGDIEYFEDGDTTASGRQRIEEVLKNPVGVVFEEIHLREVLDFITKTYEINIIVDNRVVRPPVPKGRDKKVANDESDYVMDGIIHYVNLKNVTLAEALKAILRPLGLDYSVQSSFIWISTPENLASESFGLLYRPSSRFTFRQKGAYTFFDRETIVLGSPELTWSGKLQPARRDFSLLGSGKMILQEGQEAEIRIGDSTPIQYFEAQTVGDLTTYVLRTLDEPTGLRAAFTVTSRAIPEEVDVAVSLSANIVGKRAPVDGVFLNVGEPQLTKTEHSGTHRVALGRWASLLGSADTGSALLLLFKVSSLDKLLSARREDPLPVDYVMEARILRYEGRLEKDFAKAHPPRATPKAIRLYDAVLPLKGKRVDLNARDAWDNLEKIRGMELLSAPRLTLQQSDVMRKKQVKTKVVFLLQNPDLSHLNPGLMEALRYLAPDGHVLPVSESDRIGKGIIADVTSRHIPYVETKIVNGLPVETSGFKDVSTGVLLMIGVDTAENSSYVRANIYGQIRLPMKNTEFPGEDLKEALASLVFIELQDEFTIAHGKWTAYVASVSETEHYFILLSFRSMPAKTAKPSDVSVETQVYRAYGSLHPRFLETVRSPTDPGSLEGEAVMLDWRNLSFTEIPRPIRPMLFTATVEDRETQLSADLLTAPQVRVPLDWWREDAAGGNRNPQTLYRLVSTSSVKKEFWSEWSNKSKPRPPAVPMRGRGGRGGGDGLVAASEAPRLADAYLNLLSPTGYRVPSTFMKGRVGIIEISEVEMPYVRSGLPLLRRIKYEPVEVGHVILVKVESSDTPGVYNVDYLFQQRIPTARKPLRPPKQEDLLKTLLHHHFHYRFQAGDGTTTPFFFSASKDEHFFVLVTVKAVTKS